MQREKRPGPHSEDWAALEFLEQAAKELLEQQWKKTTMAKLPEATELLSSGQRIG